MPNPSRLIYKLLRALCMHGQIYVMQRDQVWSYEISKACNVYKVYKEYTLQKYKQLIDLRYKAKPHQKIVKKLVLSSYKQADILLRLVEIWRETQDGTKETKKKETERKETT